MTKDPKDLIELTQDDLRDMRDELAWVIGNGQYGLRTMHLVNKLPDLLDLIEQQAAEIEKLNHASHEYIRIDQLTCYERGTCDWQDSLIEREG